MPSTKLHSLFRTIFFLLILLILDIALRKGLLLHFLPFPFPQQFSGLFFYLVFALIALYLTRKFGQKDGMSLRDLGISFAAENRKDFGWGMLWGIGLWGILSLVQGFTAGFSWIIRPDFSLFGVVYGLIFIFIADLGTELYYRGYPLTTLKNGFGHKLAIVFMVLFVGLISYSPGAEGELLMYVMLIPALHTLFFSIIYFKTGRLGAALGIHTGANFVTISVFDLRPGQASQSIPSGIFQPNTDIHGLSLTALQLPWVILAILFSAAVYFWWKGSTVTK